MPKKRFTAQYSKPQSTVHPSLVSGVSSSSNNTPSVNSLLSSLRKVNITPDRRPEVTSSAPSLPPYISSLLSIPETISPLIRRGARRRYDASGRLLPAGPPPPRSWIARSPSAPTQQRRQAGRRYPNDVDHLPWMKVRHPNERKVEFDSPRRGNGRSLQDMCLRSMARNWTFIETWERNNLAGLPTKLRMSLLSNIAVYGSEEGLNNDGLKTILLPPMSKEDMAAFDPEGHNDGFYRLDLSGSIGRSISLKQVSEVVQNPESSEETDVLSWESEPSRALKPLIPYLTHLSLSHPPDTISWPKLLRLAKHLPTLTHISLANWPVPSLTPNSKTALMTSSSGKNIQYGGTNYYSHSIDNDFRECATILRNLAARLYGLEYLDLTGCTDWIRALRWQEGTAGIDWGQQWPRLRELKVYADLELSEDSDLAEVDRYVTVASEGLAIEMMLLEVRKKAGNGVTWIEVLRNNAKDYDDFWRGGRARETRRKRLDYLTDKDEAFDWRLTTWQYTRELPRTVNDASW